MTHASLSSPLARLRTSYDVIVVGSGYGGAVAASRLARAGQQVCVLERGREFAPGDLPATEPAAQLEMQFTLCAKSPVSHLGDATGLYDFHLGERMNVLVGCGLGGTSLINANIAVRPDPRVFDDPRWPAALRADRHDLLEEGFLRALAMLRPSTYPPGWPLPAKFKALQAAAVALGEPVKQVALAVSYEDGVNHVGVRRRACRLCGDCVSGCNHQAKGTLDANYLADAHNHGAELFTRISVRRVQTAGDRWLVHVSPLGYGRERFAAPDMSLRAKIVVLAAGCLGTPEILLRSRAHGLAMSEQVGRRFSANRNTLGFGYNAPRRIAAIGLGARPPDPADPVGPCIIGAIDTRERSKLEDGIMIEEGVIPAPLGRAFAAGIAAAADAIGEPAPRREWSEAVWAPLRRVVSAIGGPRVGAAGNTMTLLAMGHDDSPGVLRLADDHLCVDWPAGGEARTAEVNEHLARVVHRLGATFVHNPLWSELTDHALITVQPLGGCVMGEDASHGAIDERGRLFAGSSGPEVHSGLYVMDGSVLPRSTGANPLLTITALAERAVELLARDHGLSFTCDLTPPPARGVAPRRPGLHFTEVLRGQCGGAPMAVQLTVIADDLDAFLRDPEHRAALVGTALAPALSAAPLTVTEGRLSFLAPDPDDPSARRLGYSFRITSEAGENWRLEGKRQIHDDRGFDLWADMTTLRFSLIDAAGAATAGTLRVHLEDLRTQFGTIEITGERDSIARAQALLRVGMLMGLTLLEVHGDFWGKLRDQLSR